MEMTKRDGGALVRIGDLHTGRRFRQYNRQPVLPTRGHLAFLRYLDFESKFRIEVTVGSPIKKPALF